MNRERLSSINIEDNEPKSYSRRNFIRGLGAAATTGLFLERLPRIKELWEENINPEELEKKIQETRVFINDQYGLAVTFESVREIMKRYPAYEKLGYNWKTIDSGEQRDALHWLLENLAYYPPSLIKKFPIKKVVFCKELSDKSEKLNGTYYSPGRVIFLDSENFYSEHSLDAYFGSPYNAFPHEFQHHLDFVSIPARRESRNWQAKYRHDVNSWRRLPEEPAGYASNYASSDPWEDRAETSSKLFREYNELMARAHKEPDLNEKIQSIKKYYFDESDGLMDEQYWQDISQGNVRIGYWEERLAKNWNLKK